MYSDVDRLSAILKDLGTFVSQPSTLPEHTRDFLEVSRRERDTDVSACIDKISLHVGVTVAVKGCLHFSVIKV